MQRYASSSPRAKTEGPARIQVADAPGMSFSASACQALRAGCAMKVGRTTYLVCWHIIPHLHSACLHSLHACTRADAVMAQGNPMTCPV